MRHGGGFRFLAALFVMGMVAFVAAGAFVTGLVIGAASNGVTVANWNGNGVVGVLLTILIVLIVFRIIGFALFGHHRAWAHHGYWRGGWDGEPCGPGMGYMRHGMGHMGRGMGPGGWQKSEWRDAGQTWFDEFHRRSHETETPAGGDAPTTDQPK
jgi:hypothetical protein